MSNQGTIYSIPNNKKPNNNKLPNLLIPSPVSINKSDQTNKQPRRKPPPIDFLRIQGAYSNTPDTISPNPSSGAHSGIQSAASDLLENLKAHNIECTNQDNEQSKNNDKNIQKRVEELTPEDWNRLANDNQIIELNKLGEGNGGSVSKCTLVNGSQVFALKLINADPNPNIQKQIIRELQYNRVCDSPNIVKYYGTFMVEKQLMIGISMEYMGGRSLDAIYKRVIELDPTNRINEKVLGKVAESILTGLNYLHQQRIIHRDIKPSNILLDSEGNIKLCDFGVSGEVVNSLATTFVGTQYYMAPERIMGKPYTVSCDIWSLGLTLLEVATCKFPFITDDSMVGPIELLSLILEYEPKLNDIPEQGIYWSDSFKNFIGYCLKKNSEERPSPRQMLSHPWCVSQLKIKVRMDKFVKKLWGELD